jgi:hypothetical protein
MRSAGAPSRAARSVPARSMHGGRAPQAWRSAAPLLPLAAAAARVCVLLGCSLDAAWPGSGGSRVSPVPGGASQADAARRAGRSGTAAAGAAAGGWAAPRSCARSSARPTAASTAWLVVRRAARFKARACAQDRPVVWLAIVSVSGARLRSFLQHAGRPQEARAQRRCGLCAPACLDLALRRPPARPPQVVRGPCGQLGCASYPGPTLFTFLILTL